jgi:hypothetical protein
VRAHEAGQAAEFTRLYQEARTQLADALQATSGNDGVPAIVGGSYVIFADRLPPEHRAAAWAQAYDSYALLWKAQGQVIDKLPVHLRGEVLSGLAQAAQRTGRQAEASEYVDKMLTLLHGTPYEATAKQWKTDPATAATTSVTCKSCHEAGRLSSRLTELGKQ